MGETINHVLGILWKWVKMGAIISGVGIISVLFIVLSVMGFDYFRAKAITVSGSEANKMASLTFTPGAYSVGLNVTVRNNSRDRIIESITVSCDDGIHNPQSRDLVFGTGGIPPGRLSNPEDFYASGQCTVIDVVAPKYTGPALSPAPVIDESAIVSLTPVPDPYAAFGGVIIPPAPKRKIAKRVIPTIPDEETKLVHKLNGCENLYTAVLADVYPNASAPPDLKETFITAGKKVWTAGQTTAPGSMTQLGITEVINGRVNIGSSETGLFNIVWINVSDLVCKDANAQKSASPTVKGAGVRVGPPGTLAEPALK
jgi:hypothetical protein